MATRQASCERFGHCAGSATYQVIPILNPNPNPNPNPKIKKNKNDTGIKVNIELYL